MNQGFGLIFFLLFRIVNVAFEVVGVEAGPS